MRSVVVCSQFTNLRARLSTVASYSNTGMSTDSGIAASLKNVLARVQVASERAGCTHPVRLVAVSKTKPAEAVAEAYAVGHRDFGENYVQELVDKSSALPADIRWHFIGHLQSNKVKALVEGVGPSLAMVETVDSEKLASKLDAAVANSGRGTALSVMVQVNTSGEESKSGTSPGEETVALAKHVVQNCPNLRLEGLMTIGMPDYTCLPENFECLARCRREVAAAVGRDENELEMSMGMSGDFEAAIEMGSTNVRVGSTIFGARDYTAKK